MAIAISTCCARLLVIGIVTSTHLQTLAACTFVAIAAWEGVQTTGPVFGAPRSAVAGNSQGSGFSRIPGAIAQATATPADGQVADASRRQYYQDYQPIATPSNDASNTAAPGPATAPNPSLVGSTDQPAINFGTPLSPTAPSAGSPEQTPSEKSSTSINAPVWVVPSQQATTPEDTSQPPPAQVTVPPLPSASPPTTPSQPVVAPLPNQRATPTGSNLSPDLVVTATDVQIIGGDAELQQVVRNTIKTRPGGDTSSSQLKQDVANLLDTGFFANVSVSSQINPQGLSVVFQVEPIVVRSLQLSGAQALTIDVANQLFGPQLGAPVSPTLLNESVKRINAWYAKNGYTLARVLTLQPTREGVVTIEVAEGYVGDVQIRFVNKEGKTVDDKGQPLRTRTQPAFLQRQIKLQPGQVFREDIARDDLRRLSELGIFDGASVSFEGDARRVAVIYNVIEASARRVNFGGGYDNDQGLYAAINFQDNNFGGLAQKLNTNVQIGTLDTQFNARFDSPYRDTDPNTPGYGATLFRRQALSQVFDDDIKLPNGSRVRERRIGGGIDATKPLGPTWKGTLGLNYTNVSLRDRNGKVFSRDRRDNPLSLSGTGIDDLTTLSFTAAQDRRDNPINPGSGSLFTLSTEQSLPIGRGNILGNRLQANYAQFIPVGLIKPGPGAQQPQVLAFNVQGGTTIGDLPPYNAFVLGGINSVRGYDVGGVATSRSYFLASAEYRFPIYRFIGGVVFADFASDLGTSDEVLGEPGVQRGKPGTGAGFGFGLRVNSPFGIIRADFGFNDQGDNRFQFGFGQRF